MADIQLTELTNSTDTVDGTGVFDVLIQTVERHIEVQYQKGRLDGTDYANVYLGSMQTVLQQSIAFMLGEQQADKKADMISAQTLDVASKTSMERNLTEAQLEQQWGYDVTRDVTTDNLILGAINSTGKIDKEKKLLDDQDTELLANTVRSDAIHLEQLTELQEKIDILQSQDLEVISSTSRNNATALLNDALIVEKTESEDKNNEAGGVIDIQKTKLQEETDVAIAQAASQYESIAKSQAETVRNDNVAISKIATDSEQITASQAATTRSDNLNTSKISVDTEQVSESQSKSAREDVLTNLEAAIKSQNTIKLQDENGGYIVTYTYYTDGISGATSTTTDVSSVLGTVISTTAVDGAGTSVISLEKQGLSAKNSLMDAQTLGFASDTKQKLLKQMNEGFAVALSIAGQGNIPEANQDYAIDALSQEILTDLTSGVVIPSADATPPIGEIIPPAI